MKAYSSVFVPFWPALCSPIERLHPLASPSHDEERKKREKKKRGGKREGDATSTFTHGSLAP